jgi:hypothetical protein
MRHIKIDSASPYAPSLRSITNELRSQIAALEILEAYYDEYEDVGNLPHKWAITAEEATALARSIIKRLRNDRTPTRKASLRLARKLEKCLSGQRCGSAACAMCDRAFQRMMVDWSKKFTKQLPDGTTFWIGTIVPPLKFASSMGVGGLVDRQAGLYKILHKAFKRNGVIAAFGALDLSANEHEDDLFEPHYRPHLWAILVVKFEGDIAAKDRARARLRVRLKKCFRKTSLIEKPIKLQDYDGKPECFPYGFKPWWCEKARRVTSAPVIDEHGNTISRQNTRSRALRKHQFIEVLHFADHVGFADRLFLHPEHSSCFYIPDPGGFSANCSG